MSDVGGKPSAAAPVRTIRPDEVPRVWEMLRGLAEYEKLTGILTGTPEMLREALFGKGPRIEALVAERDGRLVGYALFYPVFGSFRARWRRHPMRSRRSESKSFDGASTSGVIVTAQGGACRRQ